MKPCEKCDQNAIAGERYCPKCKKEVLRDMQSSGYLERHPKRLPTRDKDARENRRETKYGVDG
jgi:predicted amidophosphoribosyltransferase